MDKSKKEFGRSMVEMLGVLAIIGVLTIGGLAGYTYAMNKHQANVIVNELQQRAVVISTQLSVGAPLNLSEFDEKIEGRYQVSAEMNGDSFVLTVSDIPIGPLK